MARNRFAAPSASVLGATLPEGGTDESFLGGELFRSLLRRVQGRSPLMKSLPLASAKVANESFVEHDIFERLQVKTADFLAAVRCRVKTSA